MFIFKNISKDSRAHINNASSFLYTIFIYSEKHLTRFYARFTKRYFLSPASCVAFITSKLDGN